jgi:hypothetical protein
MQAAFDSAVEYVHERKQFGQPIGTFQLMQGKLNKRLSSFSVILKKAQFCSKDRRYVHETER